MATNNQQPTRTTEQAFQAATPKLLRDTTPYVKPVEPFVSFQKRTKYIGDRTIGGSKLRFTYADLTDFTSRPFGNFFSSLQLPITSGQRQDYNSILGTTALASLSGLTKVVIASIPTDEYGEMIDGKTLSIKVPIGAGYITCFGGYYSFNPDLNTQFSDANIISSIFGVEPVPENNFNTNIAYLFTNDLAGYTPRDNYNYLSKLPGVSSTIPANGSVSIPVPGNLLAGRTYSYNRMYFPAAVKLSFMTLVGEIPFENAVDTNSVVGAAFRLKYDVSALILRNSDYVEHSVDSAIDEINPISTRRWGRWSPTTKYPYSEGGAGNPVARLQDVNVGIQIDKPVGIVYLDKGLVVFTDPLIVENFNLTNAQITGGAKYVGPAKEFTNVFYPSQTDASATFNSVVTEYEQGYTCIVYPNEFNETTNPTYDQAYPTAASKEGKPVYITEVGLYNKYEELIAICKTSRPIPKDYQSIISLDRKSVV